MDSWSIINRFSGKNMLGFRFQDIVREFPEKHPAHLTKILANMVDKGMLCKITHDNYHIIPANADPETYLPDSHQVAIIMMQNKDYYIGYASAVKIHGLSFLSETKVSEAKEYVVAKKQMKPAIRSFGKITYQFIHHSSTRFFGFESIWINQFVEAMVSDLEKTIVDIATKPQLCGGIIEVGNVLFQVNDRIDYDKLFFYFASNLNKSARKRFLFLTDLFGMEWTYEHDNMMDKIGSGTSLLDPSEPDQIKNRGKFGLKINGDPISIKENVLHHKIS